MFEEDLGDLRSGPRISTKKERGEGSGEAEGGGQKWKAEMRKAEFLAVGHMLFFFSFFLFKYSVVNVPCGKFGSPHPGKAWKP